MWLTLVAKLASLAGCWSSTTTRRSGSIRNMLTPTLAAARRKGDHDRAISDANEAIRLDPKNALAYATRGEAFEAKNDPDHAIADFDRALKLDPSLAKARQGLEDRTIRVLRQSIGC
jgi:Tfp pilus assembly protein PilF